MSKILYCNECGSEDIGYTEAWRRWVNVNKDSKDYSFQTLDKHKLVFESDSTSLVCWDCAEETTVGGVDNYEELIKDVEAFCEEEPTFPFRVKMDAVDKVLEVCDG